jgi:hypothetical protein
MMGVRFLALVVFLAALSRGVIDLCDRLMGEKQ